MSYSHHSKLHTLERIKPFWHGSIFTVSNSRDHYRCTTNLVKSKCYPQWPTKECLWTKPPQLTRDILPFFFNSVSGRSRTWDPSFTLPSPRPPNPSLNHILLVTSYTSKMMHFPTHLSIHCIPCTCGLIFFWEMDETKTSGSTSLFIVQNPH